MSDISVQGSVAAITRDLTFDVTRISKAATYTALNKTNAKLTTIFPRELARESGVAQKHFKKKVKPYRAKYSKLEAKTFVGLRSSVPLARLVKGPRGLQKYEKLIDDSLQGRSAADAFMATMPTGHKGIYVRSPRADGKSGRDRHGRLKRGRLPIVEVRARFDKIAPAILARVGNQVTVEEFEAHFIYDLKRRLRGGSSGGRRSRAR